MADNFSAELERMEGWIGGIMAGMSPASRAKAGRSIGRMVRGKQAKRIAAQRNPDGSSFEARKQPKARKPNNRALKFLYPAGGSGEARTVLLKSWVKSGPIFTGFDVEAGGIRSFNKSKIVKWLPVGPHEQNKSSGRLRTRGTIKQRLMFRKLRRYTFLKMQASASEVSVGYSGRSAQIARVHQEGGYDKPGKNAPRVRYARRQLLGLTQVEEQAILDILTEMVTQPPAKN